MTKVPRGSNNPKKAAKRPAQRAVQPTRIAGKRHAANCSCAICQSRKGKK